MPIHSGVLKIFTVTEINKEISALLTGRFQFIRVAGEISNLKIPLSGHHYFNLKDNRNQIRAVLFKNQKRYLTQQLADGQQVICDGRIAVYEPRGEYQLIVDTVDFHGLGSLQATFEQLKKKLLEEGLFAQNIKQSLPTTVQRVIVITSPSGAAIHDFISTCKQRKASFTISILPARVQGAQSAAEIVDAIERASRQNPDVIVLCRGGGSIEDLWSFNEETVARAIHKTPIPVVTGIGHETDFTIADFCADVRCATPTAAAEMLAPRTEIAVNSINSSLHRITRMLTWQLASSQSRVDNAKRRLLSFGTEFYAKTLHLDNLQSRILNQCMILIERKNLQFTNSLSHLEQSSPVHKLNLHRNQIAYMVEKLIRSVQQKIETKQAQFEKTVAVLDSVSPLATLSRGYSIVSTINQQDGSSVIITDSSDVNLSDRLGIRLHKGSLECVVSKRS